MSAVSPLLSAFGGLNSLVTNSVTWPLGLPFGVMVSLELLKS